MAATHDETRGLVARRRHRSIIDGGRGFQANDVIAPDRLVGGAFCRRKTQREGWLQMPLSKEGKCSVSIRTKVLTVSVYTYVIVVPELAKLHTGIGDCKAIPASL